MATQPAASSVTKVDQNDDGVSSTLKGDLTSWIYNKQGAPFGTREESVLAMRAIMGSSTTQQASRPPLTNVHGQGLLLLSDIPASARNPGVCVGIDEAGRGSVLGPMVYGAAFWNANHDTDSNKIPQGFHDSKQLTEETRENLLEQLMASLDIGWCTRIFQASEISRNMLRAGVRYNLNQMSHDAAMDMIQAIQDAGVPIQTCFIDTVGNPDFYRRKLERRFPNLEFVVESKADANYATCSAASVVAKVLRDHMIETFQFTEQFPTPTTITRDFGSGYPSDPKCKAWMADNLQDPVFGWSDLVRFSWGPAKKTLLKEAVGVAFEVDNDDEEEDAAALAGKKRQQEQMSAFLRKGKKDLRYPYFERTNLKAVTTLF